MDDFQLPFEVSDEWGFGSELKRSDFAFGDDDSAELVIGLDDAQPNSCSELVNLIVSDGGEIVNTVSMDGKVAAIVAGIPYEELSSLTGEIKATELARYVEPNIRFEIDFIPNDPGWPKQWGPQKIEADWAWNTTMGDPSVLVAVVDTGIDWNHPDLADNYVPLGYDWVNNDPDPMDDHGHGTHCAGVIAAAINNNIGIAGLAQVRIMAEKALNQSGQGKLDDCVKAIIHAVEQGADIISNSWGGTGYSVLLHDAVRYAHDHGVLVIAAAGNDATECKHYPAAYEEVVAVTATNKNDHPAWFTNFGEWVEVAAPGVDVYSTWWNDTFMYNSGTSMSAPHVAGVAALIWSQFPSITRDQVRAQLRYTAEDLGNLGFDEYYGHGRINARRAVEQTLPEHDVILLHWKVPCVLKPFDVATINGTLLNFGASNENNITVQLLVNSSVADSKFIDHLESGASTTVGFAWSSTVEGKCNITIYVVPVDGEILTENNVLSECVTVRSSKIIMVSNDFPTIQKAINEVNDGYTIHVMPGIYHEHVIIDKSLTLTGEKPNTTVIDGNGMKSVIMVADIQGDVTVSGFTVQNSGRMRTGGGVILDCSSNINISGNIIRDCGYGIELFGSINNIIVKNTISNCEWGMYLDRSHGNLLKDNHMINNTYNFDIEKSIMLSDYINEIDTSNTVDEKPIYYLVNQYDNTVPSDAGYVAAINSTRITVKNLNLTNNGQGVLFANAHNSTIAGTHISNNRVGILLVQSSNNIINSNVAVDNLFGIWLESHCKTNIINDNEASKGIAGIVLRRESSNNIISDNEVSENKFSLGMGICLEHSSNNNIFYHNNFVNNIRQVSLLNSYFNVWDDGYPSGGNYWSNYAGVDFYYGPYQNLTGRDGIGDEPYIMDADNRDRYPLMGRWPPLLGDLNFDEIVDIEDMYFAGCAFGSKPGHPRWSPIADVNKDEIIDISDIYLIALNFGKARP